MHISAFMTALAALATTSAAFPAAAAPNEQANPRSAMRRAAPFDDEAHRYGKEYYRADNMYSDSHKHKHHKPDLPSYPIPQNAKVDKRSPYWWDHGHFWPGIMGPQAGAEQPSAANSKVGKRAPYWWDHGHFWPGIMGPNADADVDGKSASAGAGMGVEKRDAQPEPYWWDHGHFWPGIMGPHADADVDANGEENGKEGMEKRDKDSMEDDELLEVNGVPVLKDAVFYGY